MRLRAALVLTLVACGCAPATDLDQAPHPAHVEPSAGPAAEAVSVVITGEGFLARATQPSGGAAPSVDTRHRAWVGDSELVDVTWVDSHTLRATVPAGVAAGAHPLTVQNALGNRGRLEDAYTAVAPRTPVDPGTGTPTAPGPGLAVALVRPTSPVGATVGQALDVVVAFTNVGAADLTQLRVDAPALSGAAASLVMVTGPAPSPVPSALPAGAQLALSWQVTPTAAGTFALGFSGSALDAASGVVVVGGSSPLQVVVGAGPSPTPTPTPSPSPSPTPTPTPSPSPTPTPSPTPSPTPVPTEYTLTVSIGGSKGGSVSSSPAGIDGCSKAGGTCASAFPAGSRIVLTALPDPGVTASWGGCNSTTKPPSPAGWSCTINALTAARTVTVNFK